jgi:hypothetical protein
MTMEPHTSPTGAVMGARWLWHELISELTYSCPFEAHFTQEVNTKVEPKWSNPIGATTKISPKGFFLWKSKAKLKYNISI